MNSNIRTTSYSFYFFIFILFSACSEPNNYNNAFKTLDQSLTTSNMHLHSYNLYCLEELKQDSVLFKKAFQIHSLGNVIVDSIRLLKADLLKEAGFSSTSTSLNEKSRSLVNSFFESRGQNLYVQLTALTDSILKIDATTAKELNIKNYLLLPEVKPNISAASFTKAVFKDVTPLAALALLSQFENKILLIENSYLTYNLDKLNGNN